MWGAPATRPVTIADVARYNPAMQDSAEGRTRGAPRRRVVCKGEEALRHHRSVLVVMAAALAIAAMLLSAACGDDDEAEIEAEVEAAVQAAFDSWNVKDLDGVLAAFTDAGLISVFGEEGQPVEEVKFGLEFFVGVPLITNAEYSETTVDGDTATTEVQAVFGMAFDADRYTLVRQDGTWKVDRTDNVAVEIPDGTETIEAETFEFAFNIDTRALAAATGPVAIAIDNIGTQPHELAIIRVPADADILALFETGGGPEVEFIGQAGPLEPGESLNLVFTQALEPGRYAILCFLRDITEGPDGTPHVFKGMMAEFAR